MYLPLDPGKTQGLWEKFRESLAEGSLFGAVSNGKKGLANDTVEDPEFLVERFKKCGYCRIGTSRMVPVTAHFGVCLDGEIGRLQEYLSYSNDEEQIESDLRKLSQLIFYEIPDLKKLVVPFEISELGDQGLVVEPGNGVTEIRPR